jgi:ABC-2 type transport system permease protein
VTTLNLGYLRTELLRATRNTRMIMFSAVMPTVLLFSLGHSRTASLLDGDGRAYLMVSLGLFGAMTTALNACGTIAVERRSGWNRQLRLTPLTPGGYLAGKVCAAMIMVLPPVVVTYSLGAAALDIRLSAATWAQLVVGSWLGALPFAALGIVIGYLANPAAAQQISSAVYLLLAAGGGLLVPIEQLPGPVREAVRWSPTYGARQLVTGLLGDGRMIRPAAVLLIWSVALGTVAVWRFRSATARGD